MQMSYPKKWDVKTEIFPDSTHPTMQLLGPMWGLNFCFSWIDASQRTTPFIKFVIGTQSKSVTVVWPTWKRLFLLETQNYFQNQTQRIDPAAAPRMQHVLWIKSVFLKILSTRLPWKPTRRQTPTLDCAQQTSKNVLLFTSILSFLRTTRHPWANM